MSIRLRALVVAALAAAFTYPAIATPANPTLIGRDGSPTAHDASVIRLTFTNGKRVTSIPAGTYRLVVHDYSSMHNFALGSQTQNKRLLTTGVRWRGTKTYTLVLVPGRYA